MCALCVLYVLCLGKSVEVATAVHSVVVLQK